METICLNSYVIQTIFALHVSHYGKCATRVVVGAAGSRIFGPWQIIYNSRNLLGTVSQSSGIPTGAIIERGSNANGEYVKFADGTMICVTRGGMTSTPTTVAGALYRDPAGNTWNLPAVFVDGDYVVLACPTGNAMSHWAGAAPYTSASVLFVGWATQSYATRPVSIMAIGRWF